MKHIEFKPITDKAIIADSGIWNILQIRGDVIFSKYLSLSEMSIITAMRDLNYKGIELGFGFCQLV